MLNLKKGLAVVLAAATALTFAPVANLGAPVQAEAATETTTKLVTPEDKTIKLFTATGYKTATFTTQTLSSLNVGGDKAITDVTAKSSDKDGLKFISTGADATIVNDGEAKVTGSTATDVSGKKFVVEAVKAGTYTLTFTSTLDANHTPYYTQTVTVVIDNANPILDLGASKVTGSRVKVDADGNNTYQYQIDGGTKATATKSTDIAVTATPANLDSTNNDYRLTVTSTNSKVASIKDASKELKLTSASGGSDTTFNATSANTLNFNIVGMGSATVNVRLYATPVVSGTKGTESLIVEKSFSVQIDEGIDVFTVSYDANRTGANNTYTLSTSSEDQKTYTTSGGTNPFYTERAVDGRTVRTYSDDPEKQADSIEADSATNADDSSKTDTWITTKYKSNTQSIYLDTTSNTSAQITAVDSDKRPIIYSSNNDNIVIDQTGKISLAAKAINDDTRTNDTNGAAITVRVPQDGRKAGFVVTIRVYVSKTEASSLTVSKNNGETVAKAIGGNNNLEGITSASKLPTFYLSRKDKTTDTVKISSNAGTGYLTAYAYTDLNTDKTGVNNISSEYVGASISGDTITLTALKDSDKEQSAVVKVTAYSNGKISGLNGTTEVYFRVVVSTKKANVKVTAPASITLTSTNKSQNIGATVNSTTSLQYEFVDKIGDTTGKGESYGDVSVDQAGNVTYTGKNSGSAVVRVSGWETSDSLTPDAAYVTVNYSDTKNAQTITVDPATVSLKAGETAQINAKSVVTGAALTYKSSDESVATVDATGKVTAVKDGSTTITVSAPATADYEAGTATVAVKVVGSDPAKVTGVKVSNKKGAKVTVKYNADKTAPTIIYYVQKKIGKKTSGKSVGSTKTTLSVKKGATVKVRVKAYYYDANGDKHVGAYSSWKTLKTDKK